MNFAPLLAVTLWSTVSSFFQVTFWPTFTDTLAGWKRRSFIPIAGGPEPPPPPPESLPLEPHPEATAATQRQGAAVVPRRLMRIFLLDRERSRRGRARGRVVVVGQLDLQHVLALRDALVGDLLRDRGRVLAGHAELLGELAVLPRVLGEVVLAAVEREVHVALAELRGLPDVLRIEREVRQGDHRRELGADLRVRLGLLEGDAHLGPLDLLRRGRRGGGRARAFLLVAAARRQRDRGERGG